MTKTLSLSLSLSQRPKPWVTGLSFSGGTGSGCLLEMVLRGDLPRPDPFIVLNANPGMENHLTYRYVNAMEDRCKAAGIPFLRVARNLYAELLALKGNGSNRFDTPPFWTKNRVTGKKGRLLQKCTGAYKIAPMDRAMRQWLYENLGVSRKTKRLGTDTVCKWIGFSQDEWTRIKEEKRKYLCHEYPLIDRRMTKLDIAAYYLKNGIALPPRSVCNACFANDVGTFKEMHDNRPEDWAQAMAVDEAIRDLTQIGIVDECYVSSTLLPLRELAARGFKLDAKVVEQDSESCHSGHCFV